MSLLPLNVHTQDMAKSLHRIRWDLHLDGMHSHPHHLRPWLNAGDHLPKKMHIGPNGFEVSLDVQHFTPNEITIKTVDDNIIIEGKHEYRADEHGDVSRHFRRTYHLPDGFNVKDVVSSLSSDHILVVKAPPDASNGSNVRHVKIQRTGPARQNMNDKVEPKFRE